MKEPKTGRRFYLDKGLIVIDIAIEKGVHRKYHRQAKKRGWSDRQYYAYALKKHVPK